jgi:PadR family transcriptional regulator PadR
MANILQDGDKISLSRLDTLILTSLLLGPMSGYEIARRIEIDTVSELNISNGSLYPALSKLSQLGFIQLHGDPIAGPGKARRNYKITRVGREVLSWERAALAKLTELIQERTG